eukprot:scaffold109176_cov62-Phaeocystis_antarctica.AAC.6
MLAAAKSAGQAKERALAKGEATSSASRVFCEYLLPSCIRMWAAAALGGKRAAAALEADPASGVAAAATPRTRRPAAGPRRLAAGTRPTSTNSIVRTIGSAIAGKVLVWGGSTEPTLGLGAPLSRVTVAAVHGVAPPPFSLDALAAMALPRCDAAAAA